MTPPSILVNTYVAAADESYIDIVSKIFIICELPLGLIRLPLLGNIHFLFKFLLVIYSFLVAWFYMSLVYNGIEIDLLNIVICVLYLQCVFFMVFNLVSIKRMQRYYNELDVFDKEVGCRPKIGHGTIRNIIQTIAILLYIAVMFALPYIFVTLERLFLGMVPFTVCHILEVHFIGHLLSLLIPRLRLINHFMELSLSNSKITKTPKIKEFGCFKAHNNKALCKMEKLMNLYHNMIKSYNYLIEAIKWQVIER